MLRYEGATMACDGIGPPQRAIVMPTPPGRQTQSWRAVSPHGCGTRRTLWDIQATLSRRPRPHSTQERGEALRCPDMQSPTRTGVGVGPECVSCARRDSGRRRASPQGGRCTSGCTSGRAGASWRSRPASGHPISVPGRTFRWYRKCQSAFSRWVRHAFALHRLTGA